MTIADYAPDFVSGLKVQVFHGFNADKRSAGDHFNIRGFFDLYCTHGPSTTEIFKQKQKQYRHFEVIETGWSKMDPLFSGVSKTENATPVVMIASTFSHRLSLALKDDVFDEIKRLSETGKYNFIITLHPKLPKEIVDKWKTLNNTHFTLEDTTDLIPIFKKADILFSDTTSAIQEFMMTSKPIVTLAHHRPNPCVINILKANEIESALDFALTYPENHIAEIKKTADRNHPYYDGKSAARIVDTAIDFLHQDKAYLKRKPLNLIRKYKIRKLLHYFTFKSYSRPYTVKKN